MIFGGSAMFMKFTVPIPDAPGKLVRKNRGGETFVEYEFERTYDPVKQITYPKRASIGKVDRDDTDKMYPNQNYLKYFPDAELPDGVDRTSRSPYLNIGSYVVLHSIIRDLQIQSMLEEHMDEKDACFILDLACYSILSENNAAQYYPDYAYCHPLFTPGMKMYTDSKISDFMQTLRPEQMTGFLNSWNSPRNKRQRIYISYDSTNKNCQAGDIDIVEFGKAKRDEGTPIFNYSVAFDTANREPLFYEQYPGSINDISQLTYMIDKAYSYGYRNIGFILDRGYFSRKNLTYIENNGYSYLIMVKGQKEFIRGTVLEAQGKFESKRSDYIDRYDVYGISTEKILFEGDDKKKHIHLYYSDGRAYGEKQAIKTKIRRLKKYLDKCVGKECGPFGPEVNENFYLHYEKDGKTLKLVEENTSAVEQKLSLAGYFAIVSTDRMTAREALDRYKSRDASEKLFRADKSYLGNSSMQVCSDEALASKTFIQFIALILRCAVYTDLKDCCEQMTKRPNYMTVPAALRELEKIVMIRQLDGNYRLDHAVTKTQKTILSAFGLDAGNVHSQAKEIEKTLREAADLKF